MLSTCLVFVFFRVKLFPLFLTNFNIEGAWQVRSLSADLRSHTNNFKQIWKKQSKCCHHASSDMTCQHLLKLLAVFFFLKYKLFLHISFLLFRQHKKADVMLSRLMATLEILVNCRSKLRWVLTYIRSKAQPVSLDFSTPQKTY